jgi:hypothetical protein
LGARFPASDLTRKKLLCAAMVNLSRTPRLMSGITQAPNQSASASPMPIDNQRWKFNIK